MEQGLVCAEDAGALVWVKAGAARLLWRVASLFHQRFQSGEGVIPLLRDLVERAPRGFELRRFEFPAAFAADFHIVHQGPASASTRRCLVTACRVMSVPSVSCVIDKTPPAHSTEMMRMRVSSPSAAKIGALNAERRAAAFFRVVLGSGCLDIFRDVARFVMSCNMAMN